jgi:hypothetical protein
MKIGYSEFSFGYAFTENLIRSAVSAPKGAPIFPNLYDEGSWGFDVKIDLPGVPLFFQYKLPELMKRNSARELSITPPLKLVIPFFRMPVMRRDLSKQHQLLISLEKSFPGAVFYASSCLSDIHSFNAAYNAARVHDRSALFSPSDIGPLPDDKEHSVAYQDGKSFAYFCSEPRQIHAITFATVAQGARSLFERDPRFRKLPIASRSLLEVIRSLVSEPMRATESILAQRIRVRRAALREGPTISPTDEAVEDILVAREMARVDLGIDVLIAQPRA